MLIVYLTPNRTQLSDVFAVYFHPLQSGYNILDSEPDAGKSKCWRAMANSKPTKVFLFILVVGSS
jgi:hypothetical protein